MVYVRIILALNKEIILSSSSPLFVTRPSFPAMQDSRKKAERDLFGRFLEDITKFRTYLKSYDGIVYGDPVLNVFRRVPWSVDEMRIFLKSKKLQIWGDDFLKIHMYLRYEESYELSSVCEGVSNHFNVQLKF